MTEWAAGVVVGAWVLLALGAMEFRKVHQRFTGLALRLFRRRVEHAGRRRRERRERLQAARLPVTYRKYAARTLLYSAMLGVAGSLLGVGLMQLTVRHFGPDRLAAGVWPAWRQLGGAGSLTRWQVFALLLCSASTLGFGAAGLAYHLRWSRIERLAEKRARRIEASLPRAIAFVYALSRSGMPVPAVLRTAANQSSLGRTGDEIGVIVARIDVLGVDVTTALSRATNRTPSRAFAEFIENFRSVLQSGRDVPAYLREEYDRHQADRAQNQEQLLDLLSALAEGYVAGLVAGPLFAITILVVAGLLVGGFLGVLILLVYVAIPLANVGFIAYLSRVTAPLRPGFEAVPEDGSVERETIQRAGQAQTMRDNSTVDFTASRRSTVEASARLRRLRRLIEWPERPLERVIRDPSKVAYVSVPIGLVFLLAAGFPLLSGAVPVTAATVDDRLIGTVLVVLSPYAAARLLYKRRLRRLEAAIPDFLDRLASTNEAGMTFTESLRRVGRGDLGALDEAVGRLLADVDWGAPAEQALGRFSRRLGSPSVTRLVALITNALRASGHLGPVLRIAAEEARGRRRLQRARRQQMLLYVVIIYMAGLVFLAIAFALKTVLIPAIPGSETIDAIARNSARVGVTMPEPGPITQSRTAYTRILFHAAIIQSAVSGIVAGQMGEGSPLDGVKHAVVMVTIAYTAFRLMG
jgi:flagellar protein FlaJ